MQQLTSGTIALNSNLNDLNKQGAWLVVGGCSGIGKAIAEHLKVQGLDVIVTYVNEPQIEQNENTFALDITSDVSIEQFVKKLQSRSAMVCGVINCVGVLHDKRHKIRPEKQLKQLNRDHLERLVNVNALGHVLLIQALEPLFVKSSPLVCVSLSARVGSIYENNLGGWYGYRATKAMLNMLMRTLAVEYARSKPQSVVAVIHPGLTETKLSEPFRKNSPHTLHSASETASNILNVIKRLTPENTGGFYSYKGEVLHY